MKSSFSIITSKSNFFSNFLAILVIVREKNNKTLNANSNQELDILEAITNKVFLKKILTAIQI